MEHVEYVYTDGIADEEIDRLLREQGHGVLSLADGNESYAVPINFSFDGERLFLRLSERPDSTKVEFAEATETATLVVYESDDDASWSVLVRGPIRRLSEAEQETFDDREINVRFPAFRLFGEAVDEVEMAIWELEPAAVTGRKTSERDVA